MFEYIPYILKMLIPIIVGLVLFFFYREKREQALILVSAAFFLSAVPTIVNLVLGGPYLAYNLHKQGWSAIEIGIINLLLFILEIGFDVIFVILVVAGIIKLASK